MELFLGIAGIVISSIISVVFSNKIISIIGIWFSNCGMTSKKSTIEGLWKVDFYVFIQNKKNSKKYSEIIYITKKVGVIYGYKLEDTDICNLQNVNKKKKILRFRATLKDNSYLTGNWFHPKENSRLHGSFQLIVDPRFNEMDGIWTGYSPFKKRIDQGRWYFKKIEKEITGITSK